MASPNPWFGFAEIGMQAFGHDMHSFYPNLREAAGVWKLAPRKITCIYISLYYAIATIGYVKLAICMLYEGLFHHKLRKVDHALSRNRKSRDVVG